MGEDNGGGGIFVSPILVIDVGTVVRLDIRHLEDGMDQSGLWVTRVAMLLRYPCAR
jgi:hypothetical protein